MDKKAILKWPCGCHRSLERPPAPVRMRVNALRPAEGPRLPAHKARALGEVPPCSRLRGWLRGWLHGWLRRWPRGWPWPIKVSANEGRRRRRLRKHLIWWARCPRAVIYSVFKRLRLSKTFPTASVEVRQGTRGGRLVSFLRLIPGASSVCAQRPPRARGVPQVRSGGWGRSQTGHPAPRRPGLRSFAPTDLPSVETLR